MVTLGTTRKITCAHNRLFCGNKPAASALSPQLPVPALPPSSPKTTPLQPYSSHPSHAEQQQPRLPHKEEPPARSPGPASGSHYPACLTSRYRCSAPDAPPGSSAPLRPNQQQNVLPRRHRVNLVRKRVGALHWMTVDLQNHIARARPASSAGLPAARFQSPRPLHARECSSAGADPVSGSPPQGQACRCCADPCPSCPQPRIPCGTRPP